MIEQQIEPDLVTYNALLLACRSGRAWQSALTFVSEMRGRFIKPDRITYGTIFGLGELGGQHLSIEGMLKEMQRELIIPNAIIINSAIAACERAKKWELALMLL